MFAGAVCGKAEEAINFYASVFKGPPPAIRARYGKDMAPDKEGTVPILVRLVRKRVGAMDSARTHDAVFNEAISFMVPCDTQEEIDYYWEKLSADPKAEQCGWLKDKYGLSWQITATAMNEMMGSGDTERKSRALRKRSSK